MKIKKTNYSIFNISGENIIVAQTQEQAIAKHLEVIGHDWYPAGEKPEIEIIPHDKRGRFETETGWEEKTFGEWLSNFEYNGPKIICWED